jgi:hypothetical protein
MFPVTWARRHARERLGLEPDKIGGGHYVALSRPRELARPPGGLRGRHSLTDRLFARAIFPLRASATSASGPHDRAAADMRDERGIARPIRGWDVKKALQRTLFLRDQSGMHRRPAVVHA